MDDLFDHRTVPEYNTRAVEHRTGVPADTFRAWERRYGLPHPARTEGNYRLYSERDISIISSLKRMTHDGIAISNAVARLQRRLQDTPASSPDTTDTPQTRPAELTTMRERLVAAFVAFDTRAANQVIEEAVALLDVDAVCLDLLQPALVDIGDRWGDGRMPIGVEHFASAFTMRRLTALFNASEPDRGDRTVVAACVAGEQHEIGLMMLSVLVSRAGHRVIYLGANLPGVDLVTAVQTTRPDAVVLSSTIQTTLPALKDAITRLSERASNLENPILGYGGRVFEQEPHLRPIVHAHYLGQNARTARSTLDRLFREHRTPALHVPHRP